MTKTHDLIASLAVAGVASMANSAAAAPPLCYGIHDAERQGAIAEAHKHFTEHWLERDGRWYAAYVLKPESRHPLSALPQKPPADTPAKGKAVAATEANLKGHIVARGLECTAIDVKPNEIYLIRYKAPVFRFSEGKAWSREFENGRVSELLIQRENGQWQIEEQLDGRTVLPEDATLTRPTTAEVAKVVEAARAAIGAAP
jgi:hypothetical protein